MRAAHIIAAMLGVVATAFVATLVSAGFAGSAQPPLPVVEQNTDANGLIRVHDQGVVATRDTQIPALQPFQHGFELTLGFNEINGADSVVVPAGKRLVIQHASARVRLPFNQQPIDVKVETLPNGQSNFVSQQLVMTFQGEGCCGLPGDIYVGSEDVDLYADGGAKVFAEVSRNAGDGVAEGIVSISGYLVDVPQT
jgi:hypothetical protein